MSATIISGIEFDPKKNIAFAKPKIQGSGRRQINILNNDNMKTLYLSFPLMLTWGVQEVEDPNTKEKLGKYDFALQFPNDQYNNPACITLLKNIQAMETYIKEQAIVNSKEWLNMNKLEKASVDVLFSPILKYPKDKNTGDPDYSRAPTLKIKVPFWEGKFNVEIYNEASELVFPIPGNETNITDMIVKASNIAIIASCGGIWVANGKFGITWKLFQAVVKPRSTLTGKCHIVISDEDKDKMATPLSASQEDDNDNDNDDDDDAIIKVKAEVAKTIVEDSDDDDVVIAKAEVQADVKAEIQAEVNKSVAVEDMPKKKRVVKKAAV